MAEQSLKEKTARGLFWGMLNNGTMQVLNLIIGIFLGRLLTPADYGIVGVLAIFTAIAGDLQSAGFTQALINIKLFPSARADGCVAFPFPFFPDFLFGNRP